MPIVDCGFRHIPNLATPAPDALIAFGPIMAVEIGFNPAVLGLPTSAPTTPQDAGQPSAAAQSGSIAAATPTVMTVAALIDTGARESCIDEDLAQKLQLPIINQVKVAGVHGAATLNVYLAQFGIPLLGMSRTGAFTAAKLNAGGQPYQALIGRAELRDTVLVYDGRDGSVKIAR